MPKHVYHVENDPTVIGAGLRRLLKEAEYTTEELSKKAGLGIEQINEAMKSTPDGPDLWVLATIAEALDYCVYLEGILNAQEKEKRRSAVTIVSSADNFGYRIFELLKDLFGGRPALTQHLRDKRMNMKRLNELLKLDTATNTGFGVLLRLGETLGVTWDLRLVQPHLSDFPYTAGHKLNLTAQYCSFFRWLCREFDILDPDKLKSVLGLPREQFDVLEEGNLENIKDYLDALLELTGIRVVFVLQKIPSTRT